MKENWHKHTPEVVMENDECKVVWDLRNIWENARRHCGAEG